MAISSAQVSVTTSATLLSGDGSTDGITGQSLLVKNNSGVTVYVGPSTVDSTCYRLLNGEVLAVDLGRGDPLYGLSSSGTVTVDVLRQGV